MAQAQPTKLICPLTAPTLEGMRQQLARAAAGGADMAEVRVDFLDPMPSRTDVVGFFRDNRRLPLILTIRPARQGGRYGGFEAERLGTVAISAPFAAMVDLEDDLEHPPARLARNLIVSHHDFRGCPSDLAGLARQLAGQGAQVVKIAFATADPAEALAALDAVRDCPKPAIVLAMGEAGLISRVLARKAGAWGTFAALDEYGGSAPGQPTLEQMKSLYRWDGLSPATAVFGVVGCPVAHSISPAIHNAAMGAAGLDGVYVPVLVQAGYDAFARFMDALRARPWLDWRGLSVTIPHKENALRYVGAPHCDELARRIGAVNTVTLHPDGSMRGDNTDYLAALEALCEGMGITRGDLAGQAVAVLGAGGAARAVVAGFRHHGAEVAIYNRNPQRAADLATEFGARHYPWDRRHQLEARIIINCTPIGMHPHAEQSPLEAIPPGVEAVFDAIYTPLRTRLLGLAEAAGVAAISGLEMFVNQAVAQFEIWHSRPAPRQLMREVTLKALAGRD